MKTVGLVRRVTKTFAAALILGSASAAMAATNSDVQAAVDSDL